MNGGERDTEYRLSSVKHAEKILDVILNFYRRHAEKNYFKLLKKMVSTF